MQPIEIIVIVVASLIVIGVIASHFIRKAKHKGCGSCSSCPYCDCCSSHRTTTKSESAKHAD